MRPESLRLLLLAFFLGACGTTEPKVSPAEQFVGSWDFSDPGDVSCSDGNSHARRLEGPTTFALDDAGTGLEWEAETGCQVHLGVSGSRASLDRPGQSCVIVLFDDTTRTDRFTNVFFDKEPDAGSGNTINGAFQSTSTFQSSSLVCTNSFMLHLSM